jgi:hypothetical protein
LRFSISVVVARCSDQAKSPAVNGRLVTSRAILWVPQGPLATHQLTMSTEQGVGLHEEPSELGSGDQPAEAGKERSI